MKNITELINSLIIDKLKEYNLKTKKVNGGIFVTNLPMYCSICCEKGKLKASFIKAVGQFGSRNMEQITIGELNLDDAANPKFDPTSIIAQGDELYKALASMSKLHSSHVEYLNPSATRAYLLKIIKEILGRELKEETIEIRDGLATIRYKHYDIISCYITDDNKFINHGEFTGPTGLNTHMNQVEFEQLFKQKYDERIKEITEMLATR